MSHVIQVLSQNVPGEAPASTGSDQVRPPSVERLTSRMWPLPPESIPSPSASHTLWFGSYATDGSLIRGQGPGGVAWTVVPGRPPVAHVRPPFCDVEKTRLLAPPPPK